MAELWKILRGNAEMVLRELPDKSIDCCITSPPYYALRDYGTGKWVGGDPSCPHYRTSKQSERTQTGHKAMMDNGSPVADAIYKSVCPLCGAVRVDSQIGLEETPEAYITKLAGVFHEVRRVLKDDGTLWLNIGDSYWGSGSRGFDFTGKFTEASEIQNGSKGTIDMPNVPKLVGKQGDYKNKDLIGIPWMLAFALRADGWYLRQDIIWEKPNPMPESVVDRCTRSHEYIFLLSKSPKYYCDMESIKERASTEPMARDKNAEGYNADYPTGERFSAGMRVYGADGMRNKRDVWNVPVGGGYKTKLGAHYATFPIELIKPCVLAGCREGGTILDPFSGTATTGECALANNRKYIGVELNDKYADISAERLSNTNYQFAMDI